jgi:hypothetical protein
MEWLLALTAALKQHKVPKQLHAAVRTFFLWKTQQTCVRFHMWQWHSPWKVEYPNTCAYCAYAKSNCTHRRPTRQWIHYLDDKQIKL